LTRTTKTLLVAAAFIVLAYPGIAWLAGMAMESRMQHAEQHWLEQVPYLRLVSREYHRGVYRSTEIATYGFGNPALNAVKMRGGVPALAAATLTVASTIEHGPLPGLRTVALAIVDSKVIAPPALQKELASVLGSTPILQAHTRVGFLGTSAALSSPAFSLQLPDGSSLAWGGLRSTITASGNGRRWSGQLTAPHLALQSAQGGIELSGLEYSGSEEKAFDELYLGSGTFTLEGVKGRSARAGDYSLQRISLTSTSKTDGEFFDLRVDVAMDAAKIAALQLKNLTYSESVEHVHGPSFASMLQALRAAQRQAGGNPAQIQAGMRAALRQYGAEVLLHDPVLDIRKVSFAMPEGSALLSARISAPGLARTDLQWPAVIAALQQHAQVTADLRVDNGLLQKLLAMGGANPKIAAQLTAFEQQGYLSAGPTAVTMHLEYSSGRLTLNGHPFPPAPPVR
jgi:uncharacterized protein YdgA (DUF945 family)